MLGGTLAAAVKLQPRGATHEPDVLFVEYSCPLKRGSYGILGST